jgi:NADH-quinone oxidoreductase subunit J
LDLNLVLLVALAVAGIYTVLVPRLLYSAIGLAIASVILTILMFQLDAPLAGVFELSVCAGLITAIFVSAISLTRPGTCDETEPGKALRAILLPVIMAAVGGVFLLARLYMLPTPPAAGSADVREVLWNARQFDLLGLVVVILAGVFGVVNLFRERFKHD